MGELSAILVAVVALTLTLALVSYNAADSSFDTIGAAPVHNLAGLAGATVADLMLQSFGIAGFIPVLVLLAWAYRLGVRGQIGYLKARIVLAGASLPLTAAALAMAFQVIPGGALAWPVPAGTRWCRG